MNIQYLTPQGCVYICAHTACLPARELFATVPTTTECRSQAAVHSPERRGGFWVKGLLPLQTSCTGGHYIVFD